MALVPGVFHTIKSVCGKRQNWRLRVKLLRVWNMCSLAKPNDPFALEMVFLDEEGGRIEATVPKYLMQKFSQFAIEGNVYRLSNFALTANSGKFRAAHYEFKLLFNGGTKLVPCPAVSIPLSGLSLVNTSEIYKTNGNSDFLLDFIGVFTVVSEEITMNWQGRETWLMLLDLVDEMGTIRCAVFGDMVDVVAGFLTVPRDGLPVIIIHFAKINTYKGQVGIQNVMNATKISWNPDLPEAIEFKNGLAVHEIETDVEIGSSSDRSQHVSMKEEFLKIYSRKSIGKLSETNEDGLFIVLGIIDEVIQEDHWWYMSCSCMKALSFDYALPYCRDCKRVVFDMTARYRIKFVVTDGQDCAQLIVWDCESFALLNKSCHQLLSEIKGDPTESYPSEIMDLIGQEFLFRIERREDALFGFDDCFLVKRLCFDASVIEEYKSGMEEETPVKLKFTPSFSKLGASDSNACVLDLSPQCNSVVTHTDCSQNSKAAGPTIGEESVGEQKRGAEVVMDAPVERKKRTKVKSIKLERT